MAKGKVAFPLDGVTGVLWGTDTTIGIEPGLASALRKIEEGRPGDKNNRPMTQLYVVKAKTKTRSPKQIARTTLYCNCDVYWKNMRSDKMLRIVNWWMWAHGLPAWQLPGYQTWMHGCLKALPEMTLYYNYCWTGRYKITNSSATAIPSQAIRLLDVPYLDPAGMDNRVWTLLENSFLGVNVARTVIAPGTLEIVMPDLPAGNSFRWDVYSYMVI
jgi:hypothetical protein